jgi:hypothetical protein
VLFFPNDDEKGSQLYNFTLHTLEALQQHHDTNLWDKGFLPALATVFHSVGIQFDGSYWFDNYGYSAPNLYPEMYDPICNGCSMLTVAKISKFGIVFVLETSCYLIIHSVFLAETGRLLNFYAFKPAHRSCSSNILPKPLTFGGLQQAPPLELTERYYQCVMTQYDSAFEALGLSMGNADLFTALGTLIVLMLVSGWLRGFMGFKDTMFERPPRLESVRLALLLCEQLSLRSVLCMFLLGFT